MIILSNILNSYYLSSQCLESLPSLSNEHILHLHFLPLSVKATYGFTYVRHLLQRIIPVFTKLTTGTSSCK